MPPAQERQYKGRTASQRTESIAAWVVDLHTRDPFIAYRKLRERIMQRWGCGQRQAERAISAAHEIIMEQKTPELAAFVAHAAKDVYQEARAVGDRFGALKALDRIAKLHGLDKPQQVEHSGTIARLDLANLSDDELDAEIEKAKAIQDRMRERDD